MFGLDPALVGKVMAVVTKSKNISLGTCVGETGINKAFDALEKLCWEPDAEVRLLTLEIGGKQVVVIGAGEPGTLAQCGL